MYVCSIVPCHVLITSASCHFVITTELRMEKRVTNTGESESPKLTALLGSLLTTGGAREISYQSFVQSLSTKFTF